MSASNWHIQHKQNTYLIKSKSFPWWGKDAKPNHAFDFCSFDRCFAKSITSKAVYVIMKSVKIYSIHCETALATRVGD